MEYAAHFQELHITWLFTNTQKEKIQEVFCGATSWSWHGMAYTYIYIYIFTYIYGIVHSVITLLGIPVHQLVNASKLICQSRGSNSGGHKSMQTWSRSSVVVQTKHQNGEAMWPKWLWLWNDRWCQTGWFEYLRNRWSIGFFTHNSL